jgi:hypothetical protein
MADKYRFGDNGRPKEERNLVLSVNLRIMNHCDDDWPRIQKALFFADLSSECTGVASSFNGDIFEKDAAKVLNL